MADLSNEFRGRIRKAYEAGLNHIRTDAKTCDIAPEPLEAVIRVEQHRWFWRPREPRLILIAESHVYNCDADVGVRIYRRLLTRLFPTGLPVPPYDFINLVYCLGYGEKNLVMNPYHGFKRRSTWQ